MDSRATLRTRGAVLLAAALLALAAWWALPRLEAWREPDPSLQWVTLRLEPGRDPLDGGPIPVAGESVDRTAEVLARRLEDFEIRPARVLTLGPDRLRVGTPPDLPLAATLPLLTRSGLLEVRERKGDGDGPGEWSTLLSNVHVERVDLEESGLPGSAVLVLRLKGADLAGGDAAAPRPLAPGGLAIWFEGSPLLSGSGDPSWRGGIIRAPVTLRPGEEREVLRILEAGALPLKVSVD